MKRYKHPSLEGSTVSSLKEWEWQGGLPVAPPPARASSVHAEAMHGGGLEARAEGWASKGGAPGEMPDRNRALTFGCLWHEVDGAGLGAKVLAGAVDPDVCA